MSSIHEHRHHHLNKIFKTSQNHEPFGLNSQAEPSLRPAANSSQNTHVIENVEQAHHQHAEESVQPITAEPSARFVIENSVTGSDNFVPRSHKDTYQYDDRDHESGSGQSAQKLGGQHHEPIFTWASTYPVLFKEWTMSSVLEVIFALITAAILAAMYELLRHYLSYWDNKPRPLHSMKTWQRVGLRVFRSSMHMMNAVLSYLQMLLAMAYDLRIFIAIIVGSGAGYFLLGPYFRRITMNRSSLIHSSVISQGSGLPETTEETEQFLEQARRADERKNDDDEFACMDPEILTELKNLPESNV